MKFQFWSLGKMHEPYIQQGVETFTRRISSYYPVDWNIIATPKNAGLLSRADLKIKEADIILHHLSKDDYLVALDERGKSLSSEQLAAFIQIRANESTRQIVFLIGGTYGLHESILKRACFKWSLSLLTFPHQLVRLILAEQVYRACTILKNEQYHHQ
ncbi:MAG: 23S rRNA (pseudouridine(1915)-N(3))-methyltransferase RlmH [Chitinophagaceae bacterium]